MEPERWQQIEQLFYAALTLAPDGRAEFLAAACADDSGLRLEVESLLRAEGASWSFIEGNALVAEAQQLEAYDLGTPKAHLLPGQQIGAYRILAPLGKGGMGEVYRARDERLGRDVAIKVLPADFAKDADRLRRFEQEARATSALNHPNIITIHEISSASIGSNLLHYITTELVNGKTLRQILKANRPPLATALNYGIQITSALAVAHEAGIIHRDIKPENIMVRGDGLVKVLDFGLAKLTQPPVADVDSEAKTLRQVATQMGQVVGTARYMSPEQARGQMVDPRTDLFSLGIVLYELIAGKAPFQGATAIEVISAILSQEPASIKSLRPEVPVKLERVIQRTLCKEPEQRCASAQELLQDLKSCQQELEHDAQFAKPTEPKETTFKRKPLAIALSALLLLSLMGGGLWLFRARPVIKPLSSEFSELFVDLERWTVPPAGWSLQGERLLIENQTAVGYPTNINAGDFTMTFHLRLENAVGAAWALRINDKENYYLFYLRGAIGNKTATSYFLTYLVRDGKLGAPISRIPVITKLIAGGEYTINITAKGNEIKHFINSAQDPSRDEIGDPLGDFKDESNAYPVGEIGFRTVGQERFSVDELYIRPLDLQNP
jgi:serine/threonine protein kinase